MNRGKTLPPQALALGLTLGLCACGTNDPDHDRPGLLPPAPTAHEGEGAPAPLAFGQMPVHFVENRGQADPAVSYYVQGRDRTLYFTPEGLTLALFAPGARLRWTVKLDFVGARGDVQPVGEDPDGAVVSYFKGPREQWKTGIPTYSRLVYADLWPGIDLVYAGAGSRLEYTFVVQPGADPARIKLAYRGATAVRLESSGRLEVETPLGSFDDEAPSTYQVIDGERVAVASAFALDPVAADGAQAYGFHVGAHDPLEPLVIDPAVLVYSGFIGGAGFDFGYGVATDAAGDAYVAGYTESDQGSFPETVGPDLAYNGGTDAFVAKVRADGTGFLYAGYIGGAGADYGRDIAVDALGNATITGYTTSAEDTFPVIVGPDLTFNGATDAFVARVNAAGTGLDYAGYVGGPSVDIAFAVAVDSAGCAYLTGRADSDEATFPVAVGPDLTHNGGADAFVAKVAPGGASLEYAGYIGGASQDEGFGIAVDSAGSAYVTGWTDSSEATFPVTVGPDLTHNGYFDAFVAKVDPSGASLAYAGYIGGLDRDSGNGIAVDALGNAYVAGQTSCDEATFPVSVGPDTTFNGVEDGFIAKVNAAGTALAYAGYLGGTGLDGATGVAVDALGNAYVTGATASEDGSFPASGGPDSTPNGGYDCYVAEVDAAATGLVFSGFLGGSGTDECRRVALDGAGHIHVVGGTDFIGGDFPTLVGPDLTFGGGFQDAFVAKIDPAGPEVTTRTITLWPANHHYVEVRIEDCVIGEVAACGGPISACTSATITRVTSDEPEDGPADGHTCDDMVIVGMDAAQLRAERQGGGDGRVYTVDFTLSGSGGTVGASCTVEVPPNPSATPAQDSGPALCVGAGCGAVPGPDPACGS